MCPTILVVKDGVADASTTPALQGSQYEFLPFDAIVEFAVYADTGDTFTVSVFSGSDVLMQGSTMPILATASPIIYPDHFYLADVAAAGERLNVEAVNSTGGVATFRAMVRVTPL